MPSDVGLFGSYYSVPGSWPFLGSFGLIGTTGVTYCCPKSNAIAIPWPEVAHEN